MITTDSEQLTWTTRWGEEILISSMTDTHLRNTIKYIERNAESIMMAQAKEMFLYSLDAPEHAADCAHAGAEILCDMTTEDWLDEHDQYQAMLFELNARQLTSHQEKSG